MSEAIPTDPEGIFEWAVRLSKLAAEVAAIKLERQKQRRRESYKQRKALGLIKKRPTKAEIDAAKKQRLKDLREEERRQALEYATSCTCFLGHPPCRFCETHNPDGEGPDD